MRTGTVNVNGGVWYSADAPFGGYKQSGIGREMGLAGFEEYLETKLIANQRTDFVADPRHMPKGPATWPEFTDRTAIVTGAAQGSGRRRHRPGLRRGARSQRARRVVVADINAEGGEQVAKRINAEGGTATSPARRRLRPGLGEGDGGTDRRDFGGIDYLVNNAAIFGGMKLDFLLTVPGTTTRSS